MTGNISLNAIAKSADRIALSWVKTMSFVHESNAALKNFAKYYVVLDIVKIIPISNISHF